MLRSKLDSSFVDNPKHNIGIVSDIEVCFDKKYNDIVNKKVIEYADKKEKSGSGDHYKENRKADPIIAKQNSINGKKAEFFPALYLKQKYGFPDISPDLEIRYGSTKGWFPDLEYGKKDSRFPNVHVKSCTPYTLRVVRDYSWTFQKKNSKNGYGRDYIYDLPDTASDLVAFVFLEDPYSSKGVIKCIAPWVIIKKFLANMTRVDLRPIKDCINYRDLLRNKGEIEKAMKVNEQSINTSIFKLP